MLTIYAIETNDGVFISRHPDSTALGVKAFSERYCYNGQKAQPTFCSGWFKISQPVTRVSHIEECPGINHRFALIDESLASERIPKVLPREEACAKTNSYDWVWKPEYAMYESLYVLVSDAQPPIEVDDEFEYIVIAVVDSITTPKKISYPYEKSRWASPEKGIIDNNRIIHALLDQLVFPPPLLPARPCKLSSKDSYNLVRDHIKHNINPKVAKVTSDYDFCFAVAKIVPLAEPYTYKHEAWPTFAKRKKVMQTSYVKDRVIQCFEMTSDVDKYKEYTVFTGFEGNSEDDLKEKIDAYLEELMDMINEPVAECSHCNGRGVK